MTQFNFKQVKRLVSYGMVAIATAFALVLPPQPALAAGDVSVGVGQTVYHQSRPLVQGLTLSNDDSRSTQGFQNGFTFTYNPATADVRPLVTSGSYVYGGETLSRMASLAEEGGENVIAGVNASFFDVNNATPLGMVITNGVLTSAGAGTDGGRIVVGFRSDGTMITGIPNLSITYQKGMEPAVAINTINKTGTAFGVQLFTQEYHASTRTTAPGVEVVLSTTWQKLAVDGVVHATVSAVRPASYNTPIGDGQMVLYSADKGAGEAALLAMVPGDQLAIKISDLNQTGLATALQAVAGAEYYLVKDGQLDPSLATRGDIASSHPRTTIGVKADGTIVMHQADGRRRGHAIGLTDIQTAQYMLQQGCVTVVRLDGGGSSAAIAQLPGDEQTTLLNRPSDGSERRISNGILLLGTKQAAGNGAQLLHAYPNKIQILEGSQYVLGNIAVKATDSNFYPAAVPAPLTYSLQGDIGTLNGRVLTASKGKNSTGQAIISSGGLSTAVEVEVYATVDELRAASAAISTAPGYSQQIVPSAYIQGRKIISSLIGFNYAVSDGALGSASAKGIYTAGSQPMAGSVNVSAGGQVLSVPVEVLPPVISPATQWHYLDDGTNPNAFVSITQDEIGLAAPSIRAAWAYPNNDAGRLIATTTARLNLRQSAPDGKVLTVIPAGRVLEVLDRQQHGEQWWVKVKFGSYTGWASTAYLKVGTVIGAQDAAWKQASGIFGVSTAGNGFQNSTVTLNQNAPGSSVPAYFFRTTFNIEDASQIRYIAGNLSYNDAAIVYINGRQVASFNTVGYASNSAYGAKAAVEDIKHGKFELTDTSALVSGINTLAVEIRQGSANSTDAYFNFGSLIFSSKAR